MLEQLGIVKPFLIKKLLNIRNGIEYDGANPPSSIECLELIDIVWYFYKSTDSYCIIDPDEFQIEFDDKENHCIALDFDFKSHKTLNFNGRMPQNFITDKPKINTIKINNFFYKDCSKNDYKKYFKANAEISPHYYSGTLNVEDIPNYIEIVAHILTKWKF